MEQRLHDAAEIEAALGAAMSSAGPSILLSSSTNAIAFYVSAMSPLPALSGFCAYAAMGMATSLFLLLTFFVATVAIDEKRRRQNRLAWWPCIFMPPTAAAAARGSAPSTSEWWDRMPYSRRSHTEGGIGKLSASRASDGGAGSANAGGGGGGRGAAFLFIRNVAPS